MSEFPSFLPEVAGGHWQVLRHAVWSGPLSWRHVSGVTKREHLCDEAAIRLGIGRKLAKASVLSQGLLQYPSCFMLRTTLF